MLFWWYADSVLCNLLFCEMSYLFRWLVLECDWRQLFYTIGSFNFIYTFYLFWLMILRSVAVADVLLWKNWIGSVIVLVSSTVFWILFKIAGYNLLQFIANVLLLLVTILFFWAKSASILNRWVNSVGFMFSVPHLIELVCIIARRYSDVIEISFSAFVYTLLI